ncbi:MAG: site-specific DNA-methyltransferase [Candidatus Cryptobacteroides sp.]
MAQNTSNKLELTWIGKYDEQKPVEPRILIENPEYSYGEVETGVLPNGKPWNGNMLIHGDNLLALKALEQNYSNAVKCIYIDPPYNTGSAFDKYDDGLEHSIWLNLMRFRIQLLNRLLKEDGVIFISIDDHEVAYLQVLMDEVFGRNNFIANIPTIMNLKGNQDQFAFAGTHEYTLVYAKDKSQVKINKFPVSDEDIAEEWSEDSIGLYKKGATLKSTGEESSREDRPKMFYPVLIKDGCFECITDEEFFSLYNIETGLFDDDNLNSIVAIYKNKGFDVVLPYKDTNSYGRWRWGFETYKVNCKTELLCTKGRAGLSVYKKQRPELGDIPTAKPKSFFYKPEYSSGNGTAQIKSLFGYNAFPYPKPENLIRDFIYLGSNEGDVVLDSFLGSGTSAAVAHKMRRRYIGIEMGDHAYSLCVPRLIKVIDGKDNGGVTALEHWTQGGGFKFYELAPSLLKEDKYGHLVINKEYNADMLAAAMAKQEGFTYSPSEEVYWKQGFSSESDYIYTTTQFMTVEALAGIAEQMADGESLLICCTAFQKECKNAFPNITIKKIPQTLLGRCEFNHDDYSLNVIEVPDVSEDEFNYEDEADIQEANDGNEHQSSLFD